LLFMGGELGEWEEWNHDGSLHWNLLEYADHSGIQSLVARSQSHLSRDACAMGGRLRIEGVPLARGKRHCEQRRRVRAHRRDRRAAARLRAEPVAGSALRVSPRHAACAATGASAEHRRDTLRGSGVGNLGAVEAEAQPWHEQPFSALVTLPPLGAVWFVRNKLPSCFTTRPELRGTFGMVAIDPLARLGRRDGRARAGRQCLRCGRRDRLHAPGR